jgi:SAM-dependent methyltransferase
VITRKLVNPANKIHLQAIYHNRFDDRLTYRDQVWATLCHKFWQRFVPADSNVLDLGCGYGQFINHIRCHKKWAMDLNPSTKQHLDSSVDLLEQDCAARWSLPDQHLDVVFTSNFFEHLPDKDALNRTINEAHRCLRDGGRLIAMGPNIKYLPGKYWDFWDHFLPLTEKSLAEALRMTGFTIEQAVAKFLPYTMAEGPRFPKAIIALYLRWPMFWRLFGKQFLVIGRKTANFQQR